MWFDSFYVSILSSRYKKTFAPFINGILIGFLSNGIDLFNKEPSSITFVLEKRF